MSSRSVQVSKTSKVQSLPDDLREIAEGLINDKFGREEVVRESTPNYFQSMAYVTYGIDTAYDGEDYELHIRTERISGEDIRANPDFATRRIRYSTSITQPTSRALLDAINRLHRRNLRNITAYIPVSWRDELLLSPELFSFANRDDVGGCGSDYIGKIFGVSVRVSPDCVPEVSAYT